MLKDWKCCDSIGRNGMKRKRYSEISQGMTLRVSADAFRYLAVGLENRTVMTRAPQSVAVNEYNPFTL